MLDLSKTVESCEKALADLFERKYCILVGTGTSALWIAYSLADRVRPKVLLPAMVCLNPMLAVYYARRTPLFADVLERDATIDPYFVKDMLDKDPKVGAVVAVHLYGHPADMEVLSDICSRHGVLLIEDLAQAMGGKYADGSPFGSLGDFSVVSFGHTKILDVGGGGALLTNDETWAAQARTLAEQLGEPSSEIDQLSSIYRKLFYTIWECGKIDHSFYKMFDFFPSLFKSLHIYRIGEHNTSKILIALNNLDSEISHRKRIAALYEDELKNVDHVDFFNSSGSLVPWRFTFRLNKRIRNNVLKKMRLGGYEVSSWYPSITDWGPSGRMQGRESFPVANELEKEVVNLWVTKDYTEKKALSLIKALKKVLSEI